MTSCKSPCPGLTALSARRLIIQWLLISLALLVFLNTGEVNAAPMGLAAKLANKNRVISPDAVDAFTDPVVLIDDLQKKLADTRMELANEPVSNQNSPALNKGQAVTFPRNLFLQMLLHAYEVQIQRAKELLERKQRFTEWENDSKIPTGLDNTPPFPFLVEDQLRESQGISKKRLERLAEMLVQVEREEARRINSAERSAAKLRQANEELEQSQGLTKALNSEKRAELALRHRLDWIRLVATQVEMQRIQQEMQEINSKRDFAETQQAKLPVHAQFNDQDIQIVRNEIQAEKQNILTELEATIAQLDIEKSASLLNENAAAKKVEEPDTVLNNAIRQAAELKLQALEWMLEFLQIREMIWEYRWSFAAVNDREKVREAYEQIVYWQQNLKVAREYLELTRLSALDAATGQTKQTQSLGFKAGLDLQSVNLDRVKTMSRVLASIETDEALLLRCQQDLDTRFQIKTKAERWEDRLLSLRDLTSDIWSYELFTAEDVIEVDGQQIKGKRSITVDKVVSAILILIVGYWLAVNLAKFIERLAVGRFAIDASLARIARRWILFVEVMLLATASLMVVHIPLTVFAFMGGAVAIGAGFGMQNLLKNLISGLMLLLERPFRPGDLVEVGGVRGRITDIGVRSSHIRDANGIETLIPNSIFIEEKVTNWTLSSQSVRIAIKVGVAYGSPVQEVTDILLEAANRHGLVQDKPPPQVLFEDFGSDALLFGLYVWLELSPDVDWRMVASDLRYIINKKFAAKGISIAFPQRDVHLEVKQPLAVQILNTLP